MNEKREQMNEGMNKHCVQITDNGTTKLERIS